MKIHQICLFLFIVSFKKGIAIKCYNCTQISSTTVGLSRNGCAGVNPITCPSGQNYCITSTSTNSGVAGTISANTITIRACTTSTSQAQSCQTNFGNAMFSKTCKTICNTDRCNRDNGSTNTGTTLNCYQCIQSSDWKLDTCTKYSTSLPCISGEKFCSVVTTTGNGAPSTERKCSAQKLIGCTTTNGVKVCSTSCNTDGCNNGSGMRKLSLLGFLLTAVISYVMVYN